MNALLGILSLVVCGGALFLAPSHAPGAMAFCIATSLPTIFIITRNEEDRTFLLRIFLLALLLRIVIATIIFVGHYEEFFGGDANTYDIYARSLISSWNGDKYHTWAYNNFVSSGASAWGMLWLVALVYKVVGVNMFAIQLINASVGSSTAIVVYHTAQHLFNNQRVSRATAILVGFFPSLVLWSSQALKDGIIVLILALAIFMTLKLMQKITPGYVVILTIGLLSLLTLRFYTFYMMTAA